MKTVKEIVEEYLTTNGFDGLASDVCSCLIEDLMPCNEENIGHCQAGYKAQCTCNNGCDFHIEVKETIKVITAREIIQIVCQHFSLTPFELIQKTRKEEIRVPRHIAAYYIRRYTKHNLATIGINIGLSHSGVINSCRYVQNMIDTGDLKYKDSIENINRKINSN